MAGLSADWVGVLGWGLAGVVWVGGGGAGCLVGGWWVGSGWLWCPRALVSGPRSLGSVRGGWLVVRAVRWSVVVGPLWSMFVHFVKHSHLTLIPSFVEMLRYGD